MDEAEFFVELARRTGCGLLLDVNNLYVNANRLDAQRYLRRCGRRGHARGRARVLRTCAAAVRRFPPVCALEDRRGFPGP
jgi:hypothetical protein